MAAVRDALAVSTGMPPTRVHPRVACSALQMGLVSRLWSVGLATALLHGGVPGLTLPRVRVCPVGAAARLAVDPSAPWHGSDGGGLARLATLLAAHVVPVVREVTARCSAAGGTAMNVLGSNAASSLVGGARVFGTHRPELAEDARELARLTLAEPWLAAFVDVDAETNEVTRRGCCLFYQLPEHGLCPDCVLSARRPDRGRTAPEDVSSSQL